MIASASIRGSFGDTMKPVLLSTNDPRMLADAIIRFYDEQRETEFINNVKEEKVKYSWDNLVRNIEELVGMR